MILSGSSLLPYLFGAVQTSVEKGMLEAYRLPLSVIQRWGDERGDVFRERASSTTGIRFDVLTDAKFAVFTVQGGKFEIRRDDLIVAATSQTERAVLSYAGDGKLHRLTLIFPSHTHGTLLNAEIHDQTVLKPAEYDRKVLFLGDSITQGWNSVYDGNSWAWHVAEALNADFINTGVGGGMFEPVSAWLPSDFEPDLIFVANGCNDYRGRKSLGELLAFENDYLKTLRTRYPETKAYAISPLWMQDLDVARSVGDFDAAADAIARLEEEYDLTVIDGRTLVPHFSQFFDDIVHPNDLGFSVFAERLLQRMKTDGMAF